MPSDRPRPLSDLSVYLLQANILASPRIQGNNTPMKIYSYLHSGIAIIATNLPTHTQVLNSDVSELAQPEKKDFSEKLLKLIQDQEYREQLGQRANKLAERKLYL